MRTLCYATWVALGASLALRAFAQPTPAQRELREIYRELVEINTTDSAGSCTAAAEAMATRLKAGGLPAQDVQVIVPPNGPKKGNLVTRYRGTGAKKPLMLLGHLDVVEAKREDWERDPFKLVEENGYFYARGASDDKAMVAVFVANLIRYRREGYRPERDLILVATCDEEIIPSNFSGIVYLLRNHRDLIDAEFALNEGGIALLDKNGNTLRMTIQAGEKVFQTYQLEVTNPGGHSSLPVKDNAIYHLSGGLARLAAHDFPFKLSDTTRAYFERMSRIETGQTAADMKAILRDPPDPDAIARLSATALNNSTFRTTCVATILEAGHGELPHPARRTGRRSAEDPGAGHGERQDQDHAYARADALARAPAHARNRRAGRGGERANVAGRAGGADLARRRHGRPIHHQRRHTDLWSERHVPRPGRLRRARPERAYPRALALRRPRVPLPAGQALCGRELEERGSTRTDQ
jgi:acetylornithine deacetylase/succinyl-diaminopimelate desuccinylase-like protein